MLATQKHLARYPKASCSLLIPNLNALQLMSIHDSAIAL
ncbi:hypothetical protein MC7420_4513 [Coleofasciculus chthonoplastes PCC 7420]|uniref:Uncharacterized protein n=1 Tax=Coleofasciculus chthonoplastes PCC 7420 TaxID=118168 RepID=B4VNL8_9CYAN|nr:hypothetical protein MC7420_4513 [Coleofasciculus chthonoplastes PCC 7420]